MRDPYDQHALGPQYRRSVRNVLHNAAGCRNLGWAAWRNERWLHINDYHRRFARRKMIEEMHLPASRKYAVNDFLAYANVVHDANPI